MSDRYNYYLLVPHADLVERYNADWLVERHDHCTPLAIHAKLKAAA